MSIAEVRQLRENAERLGEAEIVALCDEVIKVRPKTAKPAGLKPVALKSKPKAAA